MKRYPVIHPFLFAIYPILSVLAISLPYLNPAQAIRPVIIYLSICAFIMLILYWITKDGYRAGFLTSMLVIMLFYYGYSYRLPREIPLFGIPISRHIFILVFWAVFLGFLSSKWLWQRVRPHVITNFLNISSALALVYALYMLLPAWNEVAKDPLNNWSRPSNPSEDNIKLADTLRPDIYYIILDGYARSDILQDFYNFDNSDFYDSLNQRGFYVAENSTSNYSTTRLSLASSLNFEYLGFLSFAGGKSLNSTPLVNLIVNSRVRAMLEDLGYQVYLSSEVFLNASNNPAIIFQTSQASKLNTFESLLLVSSMLEILFDLSDLNITPYTYEALRDRILNGYTQIENLVDQQSPKFVFVHILAPHPPFLFDQEGNPVTPDREYNIFDGSMFHGGPKEYQQGYIQQLLYINRITLHTIDKILQDSASTPIIILQGDHGPAAFWVLSKEPGCLRERFSILNAYYFPDNNNAVVNPSITPVNTFRVIFNTYYGTALPELPDHNYFSVNNDPYQFTEVTDKLDDGCEIIGQP